MSNYDEIRKQLNLYFDVNSQNIMGTQWYSCLQHLNNQPYGIPQYFTPLIQHLQLDIPGISQPFVYDLNNADYDAITISEQIDQIQKKYPKIKIQPWKWLDTKTFMVIKYSCINQDIMNTIEYPIYCYYQLNPRANYIDEKDLIYLEEPLSVQTLIKQNKQNKENKQYVSNFQLLCQLLNIEKQNYKDLQIVKEDSTVSQQFYWNLGAMYQLSTQLDESSPKLLRRPFSGNVKNTFNPSNEAIENKDEQWWKKVETFAGDQFYRFLKSSVDDVKLSLSQQLPQDLKQLLQNQNQIIAEMSSSLKLRYTYRYQKMMKKTKNIIMLSSASIKYKQQLEQIIDYTFNERLLLMKQKQKSQVIDPEFQYSQQKVFPVKPTYVFCSDARFLNIQNKKYDKIKKEIKDQFGQIFGFDEDVVIKIVEDEHQRKVSYKFSENPTE